MATDTRLEDPVRSADRPMISAEAFAAVVAGYADRVHDDVRRLGATPAEAAQVVESSALDVLETVRAGASPAVSDLVGRWFNQARALTGRLVDADDQPRSPDPDASSNAPEGLIRDTALDLALRRGLAALSSRDRAALLLRDAYELPEAATAIALELDVPATRALVTQARRHFAEVVEVGSPAEVPLHLRGLAILSLPDGERDTILGRVTSAAAAALPAEADLLTLAQGDDDPVYGPSWVLVVTSILIALLAGAFVGIVTAPSPAGSTSSGGSLPEPVTPFDVRAIDPAFRTPTATPSASPSAAPSRSSVPTLSPTPSSAPSSEPSVSPTVSSGPPAITLFPQSGPDCTVVRVVGRNFPPGATARVRYRDLAGQPTPSGTEGVVDADGRFDLEFAACDPRRLPGPHQVVARANGEEDTATFTATG